MSATIKNLWKRLETWTEENLPALNESLGEPANKAQIKSFETWLGHKLPDDFKESLLIHDGQMDDELGILLGYNLYNLDDMRAHRSDVTEPDPDNRSESIPPQHVKKFLNSTSWLPITGDHTGNYLGLDLTPGPKGKIGQIIIFGRDEEKHRVIASSFSEFLEKIVIHLEDNRCNIDEEDGLFIKGKFNDLLDYVVRGNWEKNGESLEEEEAEETERRDDERAAPQEPVVWPANGVPYRDEKKLLEFYADTLGFSIREKVDGVIQFITNDFQSFTVVHDKEGQSPKEAKVIYMRSKYVDVIEKNLNDKKVSFTPTKSTEGKPALAVVDLEGNTITLVRV